MSNKIIFIVVLIVILIVAGFVYEFAYSPSNSIDREDDTGGFIIGGDSDEYGCKASAGYSWCEYKQKCIRVWEESCEPENY